MDYPYANGINSAKVETILTRQKLTKLIGLKKKEIIKNLIDLGYGESKDDVSLEKLTEQELVKTKKFLNNLQVDKKIIDIAVWTKLISDSKFKGKILMNLSSKPYVSYRVLKDDNPLEALIDLLTKYININKEIYDSWKLNLL